MDSEESFSGMESSDSDEELQEAFAAGKLKPGLNLELPAESKIVNNIAGLKQKLSAIKKNLPWVERLDVTSKPATGHKDLISQSEADVHDDFKRELRFYCQAQATVLEAIPRLHSMNLPTKRPEDYFAQMAKSDDHMKRVREKLLEKQTAMERSEKAKKLRELRKYGKKVQVEVLQKRQKEKKEMLDAVKKYRKGQKDKLDFLEDLPGESRNKLNKKNTDKLRQNKKREYKNKKFGFGGQKKRSKMNTKNSASDMSGFKPKINQKKPGKPKPGNKNKRPGKSRRLSAKSKKRK
ncbi:probable rRNA-processing protein EBP2 [Saccostrea echinata]|uniref:probable rRNA-processing protein EBP2 n=1 Tax=Saccostrea echinata TaxID=191078 RepID=UPI002A806AFE|nr:probable rRNA-processing protein EBP2 [Saccostrea echinata]